MPSIPQRLSERMYERFRPVLEKASLSTVPLEVTFPELKPITLAARLRDAISSHKRFHWNLDQPDPKICALKVFERNGSLFLGTHPPKDTNSQAPAPSLTITKEADWSQEEVRAVCLLLSTGKLASGVTVPKLHSETASALELEFNITISQDNPATSILF